MSANCGIFIDRSARKWYSMEIKYIIDVYEKER